MIDLWMKNLWFKKVVYLPRRMIYFSIRKFTCSKRYTSWSMLHNISFEERKSSVLRQQGHFTVCSRCTLKRPYCLRAEFFLRLGRTLCNLLHVVYHVLHRKINHSDLYRSFGDLYKEVTFEGRKYSVHLLEIPLELLWQLYYRIINLGNW